jgi:hypothetical protein
MLEIIFSNWIVRGFLVYLVVVGSATLFRRDRDVPATPFGLILLPPGVEKWRWHWADYAHLRAHFGDEHVEKREGMEPGRFHSWEDWGGAGLSYL